MCRFVVYVSQGKPILLADLLTRPPHSIVKQSFDCKERTSDVMPGSLNGDGFGVGWYAVNGKPGDSPCLFTSTLPAWNNRNLHRLSDKIISPLVFAHVRAASPGSVVTEANCHPFTCGKFLWMHNGGIGAFLKLKKEITMQLRSNLVSKITGSTDSEYAFMLFLNNFPEEVIFRNQFEDAEMLLQAFQSTIIQLIHLQKKSRLRTISMLNFAISDGKTTLISRICVSTLKDTKAKKAASLYYSIGSRFTQCTDGVYRMRHTNMDEDVVIVSSERLSPVTEDWVSVPENHIVLISHKSNVLLFAVDVKQELEKAKLEMKAAKSSSKLQPEVSVSKTPGATSTTASPLLPSMFPPKNDILNNIPPLSTSNDNANASRIKFSISQSKTPSLTDSEEKCNEDNEDQ